LTGGPPPRTGPGSRASRAGAGAVSVPSPGASALPGPRHPAVPDLEVQPAHAVLHGDDRAGRQGPHGGPAALARAVLGPAGVETDIGVRAVVGFRGRCGEGCHTVTLCPAR